MEIDKSKLDFKEPITREEFFHNRFKERNNYPLTPRELEVLKLIGECFTNRQISYELHISIKTIEKHVQQIHYKLNTHSRAEDIHYALAKGISKNKFLTRAI
jgi:DNA-binding NarL/FixJ family response regulator